ncbi:MAG: helix-turn-helix domain-containing protein [Vicinamibacterales bacterium]
MSERNAFGPNLRRIRVQRRVSIDQIVSATNVSARLWDGLERNDLSNWPAGIYARSYVRSYARAIGVDPESTVDEFCRCFPNGDRRAELVIRGQAEIVGHKDLQWRDHLPGGDSDVDRRAGATVSAPPRKPQPSGAAFSQLFVRLRALLRA